MAHGRRQRHLLWATVFLAAAVTLNIDPVYLAVDRQLGYPTSPTSVST
jgi:hypothetical protein